MNARALSPRAISLTLLSVALLSVSAGVFLAFGLGVALIVFGVLLAAAELLVPTAETQAPAR